MCIAFKKNKNNFSNFVRVHNYSLGVTHVAIKYQPLRLIKNIKVSELFLDIFLKILMFQLYIM